MTDCPADLPAPQPNPSSEPKVTVTGVDGVTRIMQGVEGEIPDGVEYTFGPCDTCGEMFCEHERVSQPVVSSSRAVDLGLDAIEARANAATARPWDHKGWHRSPHGESYAVWRGKPEGSYPIAQTERGLQGWHDAEFIAHAREDVPRLVAEVRRLRDLVDEFRKRDEAQDRVRELLTRERDAARAEAERLREDAYEEKRRAEQSRSAAYQRLVEDRDRYLEAWQASVAEAARVREALQAAERRLRAAGHWFSGLRRGTSGRLIIEHIEEQDLWTILTGDPALDAALDGAE